MDNIRYFCKTTINSICTDILQAVDELHQSIKQNERIAVLRIRAYHITANLKMYYSLVEKYMLCSGTPLYANTRERYKEIINELMNLIFQMEANNRMQGIRCIIAFTNTLADWLRPSIIVCDHFEACPYLHSIQW